MDNKKNDELQSRREFFKKAAKAALPVLGALFFSCLPVEKSLAASTCHGCTSICTGCTGCTSNCGGCTSCTGCTGCSINCYGRQR